MRKQFRRHLLIEIKCYVIYNFVKTRFSIAAGTKDVEIVMQVKRTRAFGQKSEIFLLLHKICSRPKPNQNVQMWSWGRQHWEWSWFTSNYPNLPWLTSIYLDWPQSILIYLDLPQFTKPKCSDVILGEATLGAKTGSETGRAHWAAAMAKPGVRVFMWHILEPTAF